jgi:hypothetical protein
VERLDGQEEGESKRAADVGLNNGIIITIREGISSCVPDLQR